MIIRNRTTSKTATRSPLDNRGYEVPPDNEARCKPTLKGSPIGLSGHSFRVLSHFCQQSAGPLDAAVIERRRFHRLGGTIADNHIKY